VRRFIGWLGVAASKFHDWRTRYGSANEHNALVPRDWWLEPWEKAAILEFHRGHPLEGYRRLAFMMLDADVVAVSPSSVYRVLRDAGSIKAHHSKPSLKGKGFQQPLRAHEHWHVDVSYLNVAGTFFYLCSLLDGYSRFLVHWEIRESMTECQWTRILTKLLNPNCYAARGSHGGIVSSRTTLDSRLFPGLCTSDSGSYWLLPSPTG
jgi:putative transposase